MFVVWPLTCTRGDEACGGLTRSSIVKMIGNGLGYAISEGSGASTELPNLKLGPCEGILARGSNKDKWEARSFSILSKNTRIVKQEFASQSQLSFPHLYCVLRLCALHS
jgi:hypothetical protein